MGWYSDFSPVNRVALIDCMQRGGYDWQRVADILGYSSVTAARRDYRRHAGEAGGWVQGEERHRLIEALLKEGRTWHQVAAVTGYKSRREAYDAHRQWRKLR